MGILGGRLLCSVVFKNLDDISGVQMLHAWITPDVFKLSRYLLLLLGYMQHSPNEPIYPTPYSHKNVAEHEQS